jgi:HlyD family secretion protein
MEVIREEPATRLARRTRFAGLLLGGLLLCLLVLATLLHVEGAVMGSGEVTVESSVKTISHPSGGVLAEVLVRNGDRVRQAQPLLRLDTSVSSIGSSAAETGLVELTARRARLEAERDGAAAIRFPAGLPEAIIARERRTFDIRRRQREGIIALLAERVHQYEDEIGGYRAQIDAIDAQSALVGPELEGLRSLYKRKLVTISRINELERTAVQLRGSNAALTSQIAGARAHIAETREQMLGIDKTARSDAASELAQIAPMLNEQEVRSASTRDTLDRSVIRAPQDGVIDKLAYTAIGSAIPANQPILEIVPDSDLLIVEARVRPQDIDQVRVGQTARVTFSGLDRQTTPEIAAEVRFVSPDLSHDSQSGASFYRVRVRLDPAALKANHVALKAGMPAEVFVVTGNRSILSFLFKPLMDQIGRAFRDG